MTAREVLIVACIPGISIGGLTASLAGSDLLFDVRGLLPGDKELYLLMFKHFLPWDRFRFWRSIVREHRRLKPGSWLVPAFEAGLILMFFSLVGAFVGLFLHGR